MIKLLMFDLDGTLFETARGIHKAVNLLMKERSEPEISYEKVTSYIGFGLQRLVENLDEATKHRLGDLKKLAQDFRRIYSSLVVAESFLYDGLLEALDEWPNELAVVSNKDEFYVRELISKSSLKKYRWNRLIGGNTFIKQKPHPLPLFEAISSAKVTAKDALMIGDGLPDILAAREAGVKSVAVDFGYTPVEQLIQSGAHATISHYRELAKVIRALS